MLAEERRMQIIDLATREGRVDAQDAAERLSVAVETIRRDLDVLQRRGLMRRVHGGAIAVHRLNREFTVSERRALNHSAKIKIAEVAARHIPDQGTVIIDSGTTTQCLAQYLRDRAELTVVTNSLDLATDIGPSTTRVILISGRIRPTTMSGVGDLALKALENISADVAFIGANGVDLKSGFTTPDPDEASVKSMMISNAQESIVLADHSKFGKSFTMRFANFDSVDRLITDTKTSTSMINEITSKELEVVIA